ncbi:NUDIX domain-containing protein [Agromyces kandeliae]|uniref:NUDIX domain-containing protein n=1 Tax=Agromyces kandeliae TaxID=2666141 RepID=A0A6L5QZD1_9MICO|nr:NUDIX domain-containing protein [Agromyces kandeliae]MRX42197.1 NUDIX domain-containing protein [Agromyces kandeliae]
MTTLRSAGVLLHRRTPGLEVFIAHMGGPFWAGRHERAWSMPKGIIDPGEDPRDAAFREFAEEVGVPAPDVDYVDLGTVRASAKKVLHVFAGEAPGFELDELRPGTFELEWPLRSGRTETFPEIDDARWVPVDEARALLVKGQVAALDRLEGEA